MIRRAMFLGVTIIALLAFSPMPVLGNTATEENFQTIDVDEDEFYNYDF